MQRKRQAAGGMLIAYEGISGSGKSEEIARLCEELQALGLRWTVVEWNDRPAVRRLIGRLHRAGLLGPTLYSLLQWLSFLLDYRGSILPALRRGMIVVADRYVDTGLTRDAVNGAWRLPGRMIRRLVRMPDAVFFIDTSPALCLKRIRQRGKDLFFPGREDRELWDRNGDLAYLIRMRDAYIRLYGGTSSGKVRCSGGQAQASYGMAVLDALLAETELAASQSRMNPKEQGGIGHGME